MWRSVCNRSPIKKLKAFADKPNFKCTHIIAKTRELELHPYRNPSCSECCFCQISVFDGSNLSNLGISFSLSHGFFKGYVSSAAAEEIISTEEDSDEILVMVHNLNKEVKMISNNSDHMKQPKLVNGIVQGKCIALWRRHIKIETEAWEAAEKDYRELLVDTCEQKLAPNLPYVNSLFLGWFERLKNAISAEQDLCKEGEDRGAYAPQFDQLPADVMAIITMHKLMGLLMTGGGQGDARVVQAALHIGETIEHEARIHRFMDKSKKKAALNESPGDDSEAANDEQKMQKLRKKVSALVKNQKLQVRHIMKQQDDFMPWGQDAKVKVGSRLIQLLMETAYIQPPVDQVEHSPPDIRPAFLHTLKTVETLKGSRRNGTADYFRICDPDIAVELFELLKNEYGFQHSRVSQFVIAHILASQRRLKLLRSIFMQMLQEEGSGSGPTLCELLSVNFNGWKANAIVWDMLAFAYSRSEMVHDALFVIAKMKDLNIQPSILTYNSLLYNLRHSDIMWDVYNDMKESGIQKSKQTNSILVDGLCKQSLIHEAVTLLHEKDVKESSPHVVSFNTVMSSFSKMGFVDIAQSIFCLMLKFGIRPDEYSYNILINGLCLAGSIEDALKLTYDMDKHGVQPDAVTYNTISKGFRVVGRINGALKSVQQMLTKGLNSDSITYTLLICGNCQAGKVDESLGLRDEMISRGYQLSYISYSVLVSSLCKIGRVDEALFLLYEMEIVGLKPDDVMYSIIIHGLCKQGDIQRAIQLFTEMCNKKIFPTIFAHRAVLLGLCGNRPLSEARMYFDMLISGEGIKDIALYNIMINKYAKLGMIHESVLLYNQIVEEGIDATIVTFNSLIYGFGLARQLDKAMRLLDTIRDNGLTPTAITYTTLMNFLCEAGNIQEMFDLKWKMEANGLEPNHITYTVIIKGLCKQWKLQESLLYLDEMFSRGLYPDEVLYNILIQSFCKARRITKAFELHDEMISRGLKPDGVTYNILINGLCVYGDVHDADKLFFYLRESNIGLKKAAYTTLIKGHCVKGDAHQAMVVFSDMVTMGFHATVRDYSSVINRLCKRRLTNEAKVFFHMMLCNGVLPDIYLCREMMYALRLVGDYHSVHELLPNMVKCGLDAT